MKGRPRKQKRARTGRLLGPPEQYGEAFPRYLNQAGLAAFRWAEAEFPAVVLLIDPERLLIAEYRAFLQREQFPEPEPGAAVDVEGVPRPVRPKRPRRKKEGEIGRAHV